MSEENEAQKAQRLHRESVEGALKVTMAQNPELWTELWRAAGQLCDSVEQNPQMPNVFRDLEDVRKVGQAIRKEQLLTLEAAREADKEQEDAS